MPEYLAPRVFVEQTPDPHRSITGVSTDTAGFVGQTEKGPVEPRLVTSWGEFVAEYGDTHPSVESFLPFAVKGFFDNGGRRAFIARVHAEDVGGTEGTRPIGSSEYLGTAAVPDEQRTGLAALEIIDEVSILCVPDEVHPSLDEITRSDIRNAVVDQCERLGDRFAVLQVPAGQSDARTIDPPMDTAYAAIYYPWIRVSNPRTGDAELIPPGGHVAGIYARTDAARGVHKAPANEVVRGLVTPDPSSNLNPLERTVTAPDQEILNPKGINVIRDFRSAGRGIRVWGARTISSDPEWKYVSVRRLFIFLEESIQKGTEWVVFEPNGERAWNTVGSSIDDFLMAQWRSGALQGGKPEEAFFVRCDRTTMTQDDIDNGRLVCLIGVAPLKPAEFVIFRIGQKTADAE